MFAFSEKTSIKRFNVRDREQVIKTAIATTECLPNAASIDAMASIENLEKHIKTSLTIAPVLALLALVAMAILISI